MSTKFFEIFYKAIEDVHISLEGTEYRADNFKLYVNPKACYDIRVNDRYGTLDRYGPSYPGYDETSNLQYCGYPLYIVSKQKEEIILSWDVGLDSLAGLDFLASDPTKISLSKNNFITSKELIVEW